MISLALAKKALRPIQLRQIARDRPASRSRRSRHYGLTERHDIKTLYRRLKARDRSGSQTSSGAGRPTLNKSDTASFSRFPNARPTHYPSLSLSQLAIAPPLSRMVYVISLSRSFKARHQYISAKLPLISLFLQFQSKTSIFPKIFLPMLG